MSQEFFEFKKFKVRHQQSSIKIGVDAVLLGAWANPSANRILDIGCGCGILSLMMAQRNEGAEITAIDIHKDSVEEAQYNFNISPWKERLKSFCKDIFVFCDENSIEFNSIISNPPFYSSGVKLLDTPRLKARHQGKLTPQGIFILGARLLAPRGTVSMIIPIEFKYLVEKEALTYGFKIIRRCFVRRSENHQFKRLLLECEKIIDSAEGDKQKIYYICDKESQKAEDVELTLFTKEDFPTSDYKKLCKEFYLKF